MRRAANLRWGAAVIVAAAVLRAAFLLSTLEDPVFRVPYLDGAFYHVWARSLADGSGDFQGPYFLGPLYPYLVSFLYRVIGPEPVAVRITQSLLGVLDVGLVWILGRRLFGPGAGLVSAGLLALYGPLVFYENLVLMESLLLTLVLAGLCVLLISAWSTTRRALACGFLLGLASLGRPSVLLLFPVVAGALSRRARFRGVVALASVWLLVLLPVLVRNARQGGGLVVTTNGGVNFYAGNAPKATGRFRSPPGIHFFSTPVLDSKQPGAPLPPAVAERALTVLAIAGNARASDSGYWMERAMDWIASEPLGFAALLLRKAWLLLQGREVGQIESYRFHEERLAWLALFFVDFTWIWSLAALGVFRSIREKREGTRVVLAFAIALLLPCILFFVTTRYRLAALPPLVLFAGHGAATLGRWVQDRRLDRIGLALLVLVPLATLTRLGGRPPAGAEAWEKAQMAERLYALGDLEGAIGFMEQAARSLPGRFEILLNLALYWSEREAPGDLERSESLLRQLTQRFPDRAVAHYNLGTVLEQRGRLPEASSAFRDALRVDPGFEPARARLRQSP